MDAIEPGTSPLFAQGLRFAELSSEAHLTLVDEIVREISTQIDPQLMVSLFRKRVPMLFGGESSVSLSRRGLQRPSYRITRSTRWTDDVNPWKEPHRLPLLNGGLLGELIYAGKPQRMRDVTVADGDPALSYFEGVRSLVALPIYDNGEALNMVVRMSADLDEFDRIRLGDALLASNLFGRATHNLLLTQELQAAYAELDHELQSVGHIQRSLLPERLPDIPTLDVAASYKTAARAGGDYYDFFELADGRWGVLIADASGHGTPAAVVMAMLRTMLHSECRKTGLPGEVLQSANDQLCDHSDRTSGAFVTAFYGVYDPRDRTMVYACAGHNPPLLVDRHAHVRELDDAQSLPLAVDVGTVYPMGDVQLAAGDTLLLYTDGIIEAVNERGEMYGHGRLLSCVNENVPNAQHVIDCVTHKMMSFIGNGSQEDDQTMVALRVS